MFLEVYLITYCGRIVNVSFQIHPISNNWQSERCKLQVASLTRGKADLIDFKSHVQMISFSNQFQMKKRSAKSLAEMETCYSATMSIKFRGNERKARKTSPPEEALHYLFLNDTTSIEPQRKSQSKALLTTLACQ